MDRRFVLLQRGEACLERGKEESVDMMSLNQMKMFPFSNVRFRADSMQFFLNRDHRPDSPGVEFHL